MFKLFSLLFFIVLIQVIGNAMAGPNPGFGPGRGNDNGRGSVDDLGRRRDRWTWCQCRLPPRRGGRDEL